MESSPLCTASNISAMLTDLKEKPRDQWDEADADAVQAVKLQYEYGFSGKGKRERR